MTVKFKKESSSHYFLRQLKAFIMALLGLILIGSIWLNIYLFKEKQVLIEENTKLNQTIAENSRLVARLSNLETFLSKQSPEILKGLVIIPKENPQLENVLDERHDKEEISLPKQTSGDVLAQTAEQKTGEESSSSASADISSLDKSGIKDLNENAQILAVKETGKKGLEVKEETKEQEPKVESLIAKTSTTAETNSLGVYSSKASSASLVSTSSSMSTSSSSPSVSSVEIGQKKPSVQKQALTNEGYVDLSRPLIRVNNKNIQIDFEIRNAGKIYPCEGRIFYTLIVEKDGKQERLDLSRATDSFFRINHLKFVSSTAKLTESIQGDKVLLEIRVRVEEQEVYKNYFDVSI